MREIRWRSGVGGLQSCSSSSSSARIGFCGVCSDGISKGGITGGIPSGSAAAAAAAAASAEATASVPLRRELIALYDEATSLRGRRKTWGREERPQNRERPPS